MQHSQQPSQGRSARFSSCIWKVPVDCNQCNHTLVIFNTFPANLSLCRRCFVLLFLLFPSLRAIFLLVQCWIISNKDPHCVCIYWWQWNSRLCITCHLAWVMMISLSFFLFSPSMDTSFSQRLFPLRQTSSPGKQIIWWSSRNTQSSAFQLTRNFPSRDCFASFIRFCSTLYRPVVLGINWFDADRGRFLFSAHRFHSLRDLLIVYDALQAFSQITRWIDGILSFNGHRIGAVEKWRNKNNK